MNPVLIGLTAGAVLAFLLSENGEQTDDDKLSSSGDSGSSGNRGSESGSDVAKPTRRKSSVKNVPMQLRKSKRKKQDASETNSVSTASGDVESGIRGDSMGSEQLSTTEVGSSTEGVNNENQVPTE